MIRSRRTGRPKWRSAPIPTSRCSTSRVRSSRGSRAAYRDRLYAPGHHAEARCSGSLPYLLDGERSVPALRVAREHGQWSFLHDRGDGPGFQAEREPHAVRDVYVPEQPAGCGSDCGSLGRSDASTMRTYDDAAVEPGLYNGSDRGACSAQRFLHLSMHVGWNHHDHERWADGGRDASADGTHSFQLR